MSDSKLLEREVVDYLLKASKRIDARFEYRRMKWIGRKGAPDLLLIYPTLNVYAMAETKRSTGGILSVHQQREIALLRKANLEVVTIKDHEQVQDFIEYVQRKAENGRERT